MTSSRKLGKGTNQSLGSLATSVQREEGQTMVEYGLILALVMLVALATFTGAAELVVGLYDRVTAVLP